MKQHKILTAFLFFGFANLGFAQTNTIVPGNTSGNSAYQNNVFVGNNVATEGTSNVFVGSNTGHVGTGNNNGNTFIGSTSGNANLNNDNTYVGNQSGQFNASGARNVFLGSMANQNSASGSLNVFLGYKSGFRNTGNSNIFIGHESGLFNTSGTGNIFIGGSGRNNSTGSGNVMVGGGQNSNGSDNAFFGPNSGNNVTTGSGNTMIGLFSGTGVSTGSFNTIVGGTYGLAADLHHTVILADGQGNERLYITNSGFAGLGTRTPQNKLDVRGSVAIGANYAGSSTAPASGLIVEGNTGIGTSAPQNRLEITGAANTSGLRFTNLTTATTVGVTNNINNKFLTVNAAGDVVLQNLAPGTAGATAISAGTNTTVAGNGSVATPYQVNSKNIYTDNGSLTSNRVVTMGNFNLSFNSASATGGKIYIGETSVFPTTTGNYKLYVEGGILTEKVKVALRSTTNWADYVFANDYKLKPLSEVESFIKENKHLPGIYSAQELVNEGLDLGSMQSKQMEKIEELTLYLIAQNKKLEKQDQEIEVLKAQVKALLAKKL